MPHKHNADRRHHIPKMAFKVQNWPEYEAALRRRGSLTLWIEGAALDHWQTFGPGGQAHCEMNGAIRRRRNRLANRDQVRGTCRAVATNRTHRIVKIALRSHECRVAASSKASYAAFRAARGESRNTR
jgi:hypothetical protein